MRLVRTFAALLAQAALLGAPLLVSAHAAPTNYFPRAGHALNVAPQKVEILFTERIEPAASRIRLLESSGSVIPVRLEVDKKDPRIFRAHIAMIPHGQYAVSWHVVSADDGHFTKGAYGFSVGTTTAPGIMSESGFEVAHSSTLGEATMIWLELLGQAMLLALVVGLALLMKGRIDIGPVRRRLVWFTAGAFSLVAVGCFGYLYIKIATLTELSGITRSEALDQFARTLAGRYTLYRMAAAVVFLALLTWIQTRRISSRWAYVLLLAVALFSEFARARVSHAAASEFYPAFSVFINFVHLVFKDLWVGLALLFAAIRTPLGPIALAMSRSASKIFALCFIVGGVTGSYIIWLHLKDPAYILTTAWGIRFIWLSAFGALLFLPRMFQEAIRPSRTVLYFEAGIGIMLLAATGIMIITTPPIDIRPPYERIAVHDNGRVVLSPHPVNRDEMLIRISPQSPEVTNLTVTLTEEAQNIGPIVASVQKVFPGGYVFKKSEMPVLGDWKVNVSARREGLYDLNLETRVHEPAVDHGHPRRFDRLTIGVLLAGAVIIVFGSLWYKGLIARYWRAEELEVRAFEHAFFGLAFLLVFFYAISVFIKSPFRYACEGNGHAWTESPPVVGEQQVGNVAVPGCTAYGYHFPLREEYEYFSRSAASTVSWVSNAVSPRAGVPFPVSFEVRDVEDGVVNFLPSVHEAPMHVLLVSDNFLHFVHTHAKKGNPGYFDARLIFPSAGEYLVAFDYVLRTTPTINTMKVSVRGPRTQPFIPDWESRTQFVGPYGISFDHADIVAGRDAKLSYAVTKKGEPVHSFAPHYGALMHLFAVSEDKTHVIHGHVPLTHDEPAGGHGHGIGTPKQAKEHTGNLEGNIIFPTPGTYHVYGEFKVGADVITSHFIVDVR